MKIPKIRNTEGEMEPVTLLPDEFLVEGFLYATAYSASEDSDLVSLLQYAERDRKKSGAILRRCLEGNARLLAVYPGRNPGLNETPPKEAVLIGDILDGALYLVYT